jgi:DHA1 family bicyclomycin/chloramphenicol resistance-like MFS transporter
VVQNVIGFSETQLLLVFALKAVAITITSAVAAALAGNVSYRTMIAVGLEAAVPAGAGLLTAALHGEPVVARLLLFAFFQGFLGLGLRNATASTVAEAGRHADTASAFLGFLQFALAAAVSPLVGIDGENTAVPMGIATVIFRRSRRDRLHHPHPRRTMAWTGIRCPQA